MSMITFTEIMRIAELRDELVTHGQLRKHGLSDDTITYWMKTRLLTPVFRRVYSVVPGPVSYERRALAACLAAPHGVLSYATAAAHWKLRRAPRGTLDMTVRAPRQLRLPDVRAHRIIRLDPEDVVHYPNGLRMTTPARTLFDLASILNPSALESAAQDALNRRLCTPWSLGDVGDRMVRQGRPGSTAFRALAAGRAAELPAVGSDAELVLAAALEGHGLPQFTRQFEVSLGEAGIIRLDLAIPLDRFNVEVDDPAWHGGPVAMQRDHARDIMLRADGWDVLRVTTEDVFDRLRSTTAHIALIYLRLRSGRSLCA